MVSLRWLLLLSAMTIASSSLAVPMPRLNWTPVYSWDKSQPFDGSIFRFEKGHIRNNEAQYYTETSDTVVISDEGLQLRGIRAHVLNASYEKGSDDWRKRQQWSPYASASMITVPAWQNLKVEVTARINDSTGAWPAIWLRANNADRYGEVDLVEQVGYRPWQLWSSFHLGANANNRFVVTTQRIIPDFTNRDVTYAAELTPENAMIFIDKQLVLSVPRKIQTQGTTPLDQPFRLIMNMALGGSWGGKIDNSKLPATMTIRSIKIWTLASPTTP